MYKLFNMKCLNINKLGIFVWPPSEKSDSWPVYCIFIHDLNNFEVFDIFSLCFHSLPFSRNNDINFFFTQMTEVFISQNSTWTRLILCRRIFQVLRTESVAFFALTFFTLLTFFALTAYVIPKKERATESTVQCNRVFSSYLNHPFFFDTQNGQCFLTLKMVI